MARVIPFSELGGRVGEVLPLSGWRRVHQSDVDTYADSTNDHQWFCEDVERAQRESPFGGTVAPGYFLVALIPGLLREVWYVEGARMAINYGMERLRFPAPLRVGEEVRLRAELAGARLRGGSQEVTLEIELTTRSETKPVCAARVVYRFLGPISG